MDIDWEKYMKDHHIKIYTEEELRKKQIRRATRMMLKFARKHKDEILNGMRLLHASET